jgi:hypothetical protein
MGTHFGKCNGFLSFPFYFGLTVRWQNQFVHKLGPLGLDPFRMLVVDFMHECELGTWKALFTHLIRLLYALPQGSQLVAMLDCRYGGGGTGCRYLPLI